MARTRTLTQLIADVRRVADIEGQNATTGRHTDSALTREINQSIQAFRLMVSEAGHDYYRVAFAGTVPAGSNLTNIPTNLVRCYAVLMGLSSTSDLWELEPATWRNLNQYGTATRGAPRFYRISGSSFILHPTTDRDYYAVVNYLDTGTDLSAGSDTFDGIAGWEEWIVYDVACKVSTRDRDGERFGILATERGKLESAIRDQAPRLVKEAAHGEDTRWNRRQSWRRQWWP